MIINPDLTETLDLSPLETQEVDLYKPDQDTDEDKLQADLDYARENLYSVIESSKDALKNLVDIAKQAENPKVYDALSGMIKAISDVNKDLIGLQKSKKEIKGLEAGTTNVTNNILFAGTSSELLTKLNEKLNTERQQLKVIENKNVIDVEVTDE